MQETWVQSLVWEDPLEEGMATHSSILAWRIPMDRGAWRAAVHGVAKRRTRLSDWAHEHKAVKSSWACNSYLLPDSGAEAGCPAAPGWVLQSHLVGFLGNKAVEVPLSFGNIPSSCDSWDFKRRNLDLKLGLAEKPFFLWTSIQRLCLLTGEKYLPRFTCCFPKTNWY